MQTSQAKRGECGCPISMELHLSPEPNQLKTKSNYDKPVHEHEGLRPKGVPYTIYTHIVVHTETCLILPDS